MQARRQPRLRITLLGMLAALALVAGCAYAAAASLTVGDLRLQYGPPWQRADAEEESRAESAILHYGEATEALTVMLPRHHARLRMPEERFYRQLETVWQAQYGESARTDWLEAGGLRWRMLRRPSQDQPDAVVFHLVTVIGGRAHHLLARAPASVDELPAAVRRLLASQTSTRDTTPGRVATQSAPVPALPPAEALKAAPSATWHLERILRIQPKQADFDRLMTLERQALPGDGGITGLAVATREDGLAALLEGFVWMPSPDGKASRRGFEHRWDIAWTAPPQLWPDGQHATIALSAAGESDRARLMLRLRRLCGAPDRMRELLDGVTSGQEGAEAALEASFASCPARGMASFQAESTLYAGAAARPVLILPPSDAGLPDDAAGLMALSVEVTAADGSLGRALLGAMSVHYIYVRERP